MSLVCIHEHVHVNNARDFLQAKLDSQIIAYEQALYLFGSHARLILGASGKWQGKRAASGLGRGRARESLPS